MLKHLKIQHPLFFDNKETADCSNGQKSLKRSIENTAPTDQEKCPRKLGNPTKKPCVVSYIIKHRILS